MPAYIGRLILVIATIVVMVVAVRSQLVPASFGELGHYRKNALGEIASRPIKHAGQEACKECHARSFDEKSKDAHSHVACETCHGASFEHVQDSKTLTPFKGDGRNFCLRCHERVVGRPRMQAQVHPETHGEKEVCTKCHNPHAPGLE